MRDTHISYAYKTIFSQLTKNRQKVFMKPCVLCVQFPDRIPVGQVAAVFAVQTTAEELAPFADG